MSQTYDSTKPESGVTTFGGLYQIIRDHLAAAISSFSGTAFPANPAAGQPCYRTDRLTTAGAPKCYRYTGNAALGESGWVEDTEATTIGEEVIAARGTKASLDARLDVALNEDGTMKVSTTLSPSQWYDPELTPTYVSGTSFTVVGDQRDIYVARRRLKIGITGATIYAEVSSATYGAPNTTVVIGNNSAAIDNTIATVEHSLFLPATGETDGGKSALSPRMLGQSAIDYVASTGSANAYAVTLPGLNAYFTGMRIWMLPNFANTGAATVNANALGAKNIKREDGSALSAGDIGTKMALFVYDGTNFILLNPNPCYGESVLANNFDFTSSSGWTETGLEITLPGAGTYHIFGFAAGLGNATAADRALSVKLYNSTDSADVANSHRRLAANGSANVNFYGSVSWSIIVTVTAGKTIKLLCYAQSATTWNAALISSLDTATKTNLGYRRID